MKFGIIHAIITKNRKDLTMIERKYKRTARVGLFAVGHSVYWGQFEGLLDNLLSYHATLRKKLEGMEVEVVDFGMVDENEKAFEVLDGIKGAGLDLLFCNMASEIFIKQIHQ